MARTDWRSASAYEDLRLLDAPAFAYEFLRRNTEFLSDYARLIRASRRGATDPAEAGAFAQRWGVRFRSQARSSPTRRRSVDAPGASERGDPDQHSRRPRRP